MLLFWISKLFEYAECLSLETQLINLTLCKSVKQILFLFHIKSCLCVILEIFAKFNQLFEGANGFDGTEGIISSVPWFLRCPRKTSLRLDKCQL